MRKSFWPYMVVCRNVSVSAEIQYNKGVSEFRDPTSLNSGTGTWIQIRVSEFRDPRAWIQILGSEFKDVSELQVLPNLIYNRILLDYALIQNLLPKAEYFI